MGKTALHVRENTVKATVCTHVEGQRQEEMVVGVFISQDRAACREQVAAEGRGWLQKA